MRPSGFEFILPDIPFYRRLTVLSASVHAEIKLLSTCARVNVDDCVSDPEAVGVFSDTTRCADEE